MKLGVLALVAVVAVTGCSSLRSSLNHVVDPTPSATPTLSCYEQYRKWVHPNRRHLNREYHALVRSAVAKADAGDLAGFIHTLRRGGRELARIPHPPYCADPHGYFARIIGKINFAADNARSASTEGLRAALAPLRRVDPLIKKLNREVRRRVHKPANTPGVTLTAATGKQPGTRR
ncbi:MAG TPA: hypothetical protein VH641_22220 [Streptosporangiaceae bacterium]|jgi:hypothetical protein